MLTPEAIYFMQTASPSPNYLKILKNEILNIALQKSFIHTCRHIKTQEKKTQGNLLRTHRLILKYPFSNCVLFTGISDNTTKFVDSSKTTKVTQTVVHK